MRFVVRSVSVEPNVRGQALRRVHLSALPGEAFVGETALPDGVTAPDPDATISMLVNPAFAKRFQLGDEFDVSFRERE